MLGLNQLSKTERRGLYAAIIGVLLCLYFLFFSGGQDLLDRTGEVQIGAVEVQTRDIRLKAKGSYSWMDARRGSNLYVGDSLYSGRDSNVVVGLSEGGEVNIGENSLVTFDMIDNQKVVSLGSGTFRLKVNGAVKVAVGGELMKINGSNSELNIDLTKGQRPEIKILKGDAKVQKEATVTRSDRLVPVRPVVYKWKLKDLFMVIDNQYYEKDSPPPYVEVQNLLTWSQEAATPAVVEWANNPEFKNKLTFQAPSRGLELQKAYVGENYWRVSFDAKTWSNPQKFILEPSFLEGAEPTTDSYFYEAPFLTERLSVTVPLVTKAEVKGYLVQASRSDQFVLEQTKTFWSPSNRIALTFSQPGMYYYRFRGVNRREEVSRWSKAVQFNVFEPQAPAAPTIAKRQLEGFVGDRFQLLFKTQEKQTRLELINERGQKVKRIKGNSLVWVPSEAGSYKARAYQVNKYGLESPASQYVSVVVKDKPVVTKQPTRAPAQENQTVATQPPPPYQYINERYKNTQFSVQGLMWTLQSTDLEQAREHAPIATGLGLRGYYWKGPHGFEGSIKSGVLGLNDTGREGASLKSIEPRYHYRFITRSPFRAAREFMVSIFGGFELYRNSATNISNQYDLMKFGTALEFPYLRRWSSGGEFVYGMGFEGSNKFEVSGNLNYFFDPEWSFGVGYRLHLFEAGSKAASPSGLLPYREGYTEGFSVLNYHF